MFAEKQNAKIKIQHQVTQEPISGTMSCACYAWMCNKIKVWYVSRKNITFCCFWYCYLCCALLTVQTATKLRYSCVKIIACDMAISHVMASRVCINIVVWTHFCTASEAQLVFCQAATTGMPSYTWLSQGYTDK